MMLKPNIRIWPNTGQNIWTSVCVTVDQAKKVAQMFSGPNMSIRKVLPSKVRTRPETVFKTTVEGEKTIQSSSRFAEVV